MNKQGLATALSKRLGLERTTVTVFVDALLDEIVSTCASGEDVKLTNFGQFEVRGAAAVKRVNPRTGEPVLVPETTKIRFRPARQFKTRVSGREAKG